MGGKLGMAEIFIGCCDTTTVFPKDGSQCVQFFHSGFSNKLPNRSSRISGVGFTAASVSSRSWESVSATLASTRRSKSDDASAQITLIV
ncbi:hypothetical protein T4E_8820 [Trichinella pseudospiralis]|uniref:Uncharacterized protein n=1 Tax=Trichinella pseudospiralis TaxID=6337 RepID=A0A0V0WM96_TRIPS|nr:hypothetical protein T4E_8820 [Trichinella pseudospiralis]